MLGSITATIHPTIPSHNNNIINDNNNNRWRNLQTTSFQKMNRKKEKTLKSLLLRN
jgi:hypothetical protein